MWFNVCRTFYAYAHAPSLTNASQAINYLLTRPEPNSDSGRVSVDSPTARRRGSVSNLFGPGASSKLREGVGRGPSSPHFSTPHEKQGAGQMYTHSSASEPRLTPRVPNRHSHFPYKRPGTPAAEFLEATADYGSPRSPRKAVISSPTKFGSDWDESMQIIDPSEIDYDDGDLDDEEGEASVGFDGVENVRACCDGAHSLTELSMSARKRHLHNHRRHRDRTGSLSETDLHDVAEQASPSLLARRSLKTKASAATMLNPPESPTKNGTGSMRMLSVRR
jgi:hypothetical protein